MKRTAKNKPKTRIAPTLKEFAKLKAKEFILESIGGQDSLFLLVTKIYQQAMKGSYKHQELLMNYLLGKPMDRVQIESANGKDILPSHSVVKIIADNIRLDKLSKDIEMVGMDENRIKEMEDMLNKEVNGKE